MSAAERALARQVGERIVRWFVSAGRDLPWRATSDPYRIWVAEVLLQQTRIEQARPYYHRFLAAFPTLRALADASPESVLKVWEGAGYYARARRMHAAARALRARGEDPWPRTVDGLEGLPGFGPYTSRSVAALAFGVPAVALDANGLRVLSRLFLLRPFDASIERRARRVGEAALQGRPPRPFNEGLMELGQRFCTARAPTCGPCPLGDLCRARRELRDPGSYPPPRPPRARPRVRAAVGILLRGGKVLVDRRPEPGLLGGMWEFPGGKVRPGETSEQAVVREFLEETGIRGRVVRRLGTVEHDYSHFHATLEVFLLKGTGAPSGPEGRPLRWVGRTELRALPLPGATHKMLPWVPWGQGRGLARSPVLRPRRTAAAGQAPGRIGRGRSPGRDRPRSPTR